MTPADFDELRTPVGQILLQQIENSRPSETDRLALLSQFRKSYPATLVNAALETALLRVKARAKFADAATMYFQREALEQSTSESVARYRASRIVNTFGPGATILEIGCGIGAETIALARAGLNVIAFELDPLRAGMARANLKSLSLHADVITADALTAPWPDAAAVYCDPARRTDGQRTIDPEAGGPKPSEIISKSDLPTVFKLAPGVRLEDVEKYGGEIEFISLDGELKECVVWRGVLKTCERRATCLLSDGQVHTIPGDGSVRLSVRDDVGPFLYDPDPAVVRPGLAGLLAQSLDLDALDHRVATLTGPEIRTPFATCFQILAECDLDAKKVQAKLRELNAGAVTIIKRGVTAEADALGKRWQGDGRRHLTVFLTPLHGRSRALIVEPAH